MGEGAREGAGVRLTELLAALSLGTDLGMGHPMEHVLRQSVIALRLAEHLGLDAPEREVVYYASLMAWVGCHIDAYEQAKWFGDDRALKHEIRWIDEGDPVQAAAFVLRRVGAGRPWVDRGRLAVGLLGPGHRVLEDIPENHWRTADALMERLHLSQAVRESVAQTFERWDGKGQPDALTAEAIRLPSRLVNLADVVEVFHQAGGVAAAVAVARQRSGTQFDPILVELFCAHADELFAELGAVTSWEALMRAEPALDPPLAASEVEGALAAVAEFVDLKSPFTIGHSRAVADLAGAAARHLGLPVGEAGAVRRAALVHDLGRLGVSNAIWDKPGPLTRAEVERVRLHPYLTERMLVAAPVLASLAGPAGATRYSCSAPRPRPPPSWASTRTARRSPAAGRGPPRGASRTSPSRSATRRRSQTIGRSPALAERVRAGRREQPFWAMADVPNLFRKPHGPGWALVGDAGYHKDPVTAQGISDAFRDAETLVEAVDAGLGGRRPLDEALAEYEQRRNEAALPMYDYTCELAALEPPPPELEALFAALRGNQADTDRFLGTITGTVSIPEFFSPASIERILTGGLPAPGWSASVAAPPAPP